jgi:nucleotide-binding universal stress UspA family protein
MKWIVGLDLRPQTTSAIEFAVWLARQAGAPASRAVQGYHAIESDSLNHLLDKAELDEIEGAAAYVAKDAQRDAVRDVDLPDPVISCGRKVEDVLEAAALLHSADALVVGRRAPSESIAFPRLGKVARHLLRRLEVPIVVVPPDLEIAKLGDGPVIVAVDMEEDCIEAVSFAQRMAVWLRRDLMVAHFVRAPDQIGYGQYMPAEHWDTIYAEIVSAGRERLDAWLAEKRITGVKTMVGRQAVIPGLIDLGKTSGTPILVVGSRRSGLLQRAVMPSVASELAAAANVPVAVVAPPRTD